MMIKAYHECMCRLKILSNAPRWLEIPLIQYLLSFRLLGVWIKPVLTEIKIGCNSVVLQVFSG